jgi:hypothetical protein
LSAAFPLVPLGWIERSLLKKEKQLRLLLTRRSTGSRSGYRVIFSAEGRSSSFQRLHKLPGDEKAGSARDVPLKLTSRLGTGGLFAIGDSPTGPRRSLRRGHRACRGPAPRGGTVDDLPGGHLLRYQGIEYRYLTQEETSTRIDYTVFYLTDRRQPRSRLRTAPSDDRMATHPYPPVSRASETSGVTLGPAGNHIRG